MSPPRRPAARLLRILCLAAAFLCGPSRAVILFGTDDPARNTTAPGGSWTNSGWQWVGVVGNSLGTVIGPRHFVTAHHLAYGAGVGIVFRGIAYSTVAVTNLTGTDLDVFTIAGRFPDHAPLYTSRQETGRPVLMMGRGGRRGAAYGTRGWLIGDYDGLQRWGTNVVDGTVAASASVAGELIYMSFNSTAGGDEAVYSAGDSGGPTFLLDRDNVWKLAGVNYAVDGPFAESLADTPFMAALHDARGLYIGPAGQQQLIPNTRNPFGTRSFASRISTHVTWLDSLVAAEPATGSVILQGAATPDGVFTEETTYVVDPIARTIEVPRSAQVRFYRAPRWRLEAVQVTDTACRFRF